MDNNYFTQVAPYFQQQDQGLMPVFQNVAQQQANQNAALQQQMQNNQMAGQTQGGGMGGLNPMAMAAMLRSKENPSSNLGARVDMALNSQANPMLQNQVSQLGSSTWNPLSDYNMGTNGWGNFGE